MKEIDKFWRKRLTEGGVTTLDYRRRVSENAFVGRSHLRDT